MKLYFLVTFMGLPDNIKKNLLFFQLKNNWLLADGPTDRWSNPLIEVGGPTLKAMAISYSDVQKKYLFLFFF